MSQQAETGSWAGPARLPIHATPAERVVYINGQFVPESEARISIFDAALATGQLVVEVARTFGGRLFQLDAHLQRLYSSLAELRINPGLTREEMVDITDSTLAYNSRTDQRDSVDWQLIYYVSPGPADIFGLHTADEIKPTVIVSSIPLVKRLGRMAEKYHTGVDLVVTPQRAIPASILSPEIKSRGRLDYIIARQQAHDMGPGAMGVLLDQQGKLTEGTGTSLFLVKDGCLYVPPSEKVLNGCTRELILRIAKEQAIPVVEADLTVDDVGNKDEMFVSSTVICMVHARSFEGRMLADSNPGPITRQIRQGFIDAVGVDFVAQADHFADLLQ